jgi:hypothetical protein
MPNDDQLRTLSRGEPSRVDMLGLRSVIHLSLICDSQEHTCTHTHTHTHTNTLFIDKNGDI